MEPDLKLSDKPDVTSREYTEYEEKKFLIPHGTSNVIRVYEKWIMWNVCICVYTLIGMVPLTSLL